MGFEGYLGILEPTKITVFSTMAERGVLGGFLGFVVVPMILQPKWRTTLGWVGVLLVISNILLAQTRTGVIVATLSIMLYVMVNRGTGFWQMAIGFGVVTAAVWFGMGRMPGGDALTSRFATLGNMTEDGSYQGRVDIYQAGVLSILFNPIGSGLGATGISGRINVGSQGGAAAPVIGDAGYLEIVATYGWLGTGLILYGLWAMWKQLGMRYRAGFRPSRSDACPGLYDRPDPSLFRWKSDYDFFNPLDRLWIGAVSEGIARVCSESANLAKLGAGFCPDAASSPAIKVQAPFHRLEHAARRAKTSASGEIAC